MPRHSESATSRMSFNSANVNGRRFPDDPFTGETFENRSSSNNPSFRACRHTPPRIFIVLFTLAAAIRLARVSRNADTSLKAIVSMGRFALAPRWSRRAFRALRYWTREDSSTSNSFLASQCSMYSLTVLAGIVSLLALANMSAKTLRARSCVNRPSRPVFDASAHSRHRRMASFLSSVPVDFKARSPSLL